MKSKRRLTTGVALAAGLCIFTASPAVYADAANTAEVQKLFNTNCFECHGGRKTSAGVKVMDRDSLVNTKKKVVPNKPDSSRLLAVITTKVAADRMPPSDRKALTAQEIAKVRTWIQEGAPTFAKQVAKNEAAKEEPLIDLPPDDVKGVPVPPKPPEDLPKDTPAPPQPKPEPKVEATPEPKPQPKPEPKGEPVPPPEPKSQPEPLPKVSPEVPGKLAPVPDEDPVLTERTDNNYVHQAIRADLAQLNAADRTNVRYFSLAHLLAGGARKTELQQHRDALFKGINHLTWRRDLVRPVPVDRFQVVYRVDVAKLGWNRQVLQSASQGRALNAWDLLLLEYPYGVTQANDPVYAALARDYLAPSGMVRPVPCIRADWFVAVAMQPPLYHHLLALPRSLKQLEEGLGVKSQENIENGKAVRAGVITSGVSNHNRVIERHTTKYGGYYWRSYDFKSSAGPRNMLTDPVRLQPDGGEIIFQLPNGMQAYLIVDGQGNRIDAAPIEVVKDKFNTVDSVVRNGLACMRCHDQGMKRPAKDDVRPQIETLNGVSFDKAKALTLYRDWPETESFLKGDEEQFLGKMKELLGRDQETEPLQPVASRYLDEKLVLTRAAAELGQVENKQFSDVIRRPELQEIGVSQLATGQEVPREAWETYFEEVARRVGTGLPVVQLDALSRPNYSPVTKPFTMAAATNKKGDVFQPGEEMTVFIKASKDVFVEVIHTAADGKMTILVPSTAKLTAKDTFRLPAQGRTVKVSDKKGVETITILASEVPFVGGEVMNGFGVPSRVIHRSSLREEGGQLVVTNGPPPTRTVKKTLVIQVQ